MKIIAKGSTLSAGMSDPKHERDSDRDSLTDWTLVDGDETPEDTSGDDPNQDGNTAAEGEDEEEEDEEEESGCGMEGDENEEEEEALSDDLVSMGQRVQEIKASLVIRYQRISKKIPAFLVSVSGPHFCKEEGDVESLASTDISVLDAEKEKLVDEETDLSLISSPSLPDDLPAIKPDTQYRHTRDKDFNSRLNVVVALTLACVIGLGLGHFLGWSSRTVWQESLNSAQVIEAMNMENENLESEIIRLQLENIAPINIHGKDGKYARDLRERINHLIVDNEELRLALGKLQFASLPEGDTNTFSSVLEKNYNLRLAVSKLTHLVPDLNALRISANDLQAENQELQIQVGKLRYQQQPLPQELNAVARELEKFKIMVDEASQKKKAPPNLDNAKTYISYMSQILSAFQTLHEFGEGNLVEKIDIASDVFEDLVPKNIKLSSPIQEKLIAVRSVFTQVRGALAAKWTKLKEFSQQKKISAISHDTLKKMNRVIVNVVNKMKEIGHANIMKRGKAPLEKTINTLRERFTALGLQFDKTWTNLEAEMSVELEDQELATKDHDETPEMPILEKVEAVPEEEVEDSEEDKEQEFVDEEEDEVDEAVKEELVENEEEEVPITFREEVVVEAETEEVVEVVGNTEAKHEQVEDHESGVPSAGTTKPQEQGEGRRGGGGDKKKLPDNKKNKENKKKEKEKEKNEDSKHLRSKRSRISEKEKKKEKREAQKKEKETQKNKKRNDEQNGKDKQQKDNAKSKDKHNGHRDKENNKQNHSHRNERNQKPQGKNDEHRYYKGQYNKYDKKHWSDDDDDDDDDYEHRYDALNFKKRHHDDDDDDDDDDNDRKKHYTKLHENDSDRRKGFMRHWEKTPKKHHHREYSGPKKAFIRRHDA